MAAFISRILLGATLLTGSTLNAQAATGWTPAMQVVTDAWDGFLSKYVNKAGGVDYVRISSPDGYNELQSVVAAYARLDPRKLNDSAKTAMYINFYNAGMIFNIFKWSTAEKIKVDDKKFLTQEVRGISAPGGNIWNGKWTFKLNNKEINLDGIEHGLIRGQGGSEWKGYMVSSLDPRIHAAVNCAAYSCPRLREKAYRPENVDQMLDENMREWFSYPEQFKKISDSKLQSNQIIFWYYSDFDDVAQKKLGLGGAGDYLAKFIDPKLNDGAWMIKLLKKEFNDRSKFSLKLSSNFKFHYDWRIADQRIKK